MKLSTVKLYWELTKPRILQLVLVTTALGYALGTPGRMDFWILVFLLWGAGLVCAGSAVLNHYLERDIDALMERTKNRPLPRRLIKPEDALAFGIVLILAGVGLLVWKVNLLTAFLSLLTAFLYVLVYTPLKRVSWLNTSIGAIPGALPPLGGWCAATGEMGLGGWVLFLILFFWQHPHFYSIAWLCREDYQRGGFKMLPVIEPDGRRTFQHINAGAFGLLLVSILPWALGLTGTFYLAGALLAGVWLFGVGLRLTASKSPADARSLLRASVVYLPVLFTLIIFDSAL